MIAQVLNEKGWSVETSLVHVSVLPVIFFLPAVLPSIDCAFLCAAAGFDFFSVLNVLCWFRLCKGGIKLDRLIMR